MGSYKCDCIPPYYGDGRVCEGERFLTVKRWDCSGLKCLKLVSSNIYRNAVRFLLVKGAMLDISLCLCMRPYTLAQVETTEPSTIEHE